MNRECLLICINPGGISSKGFSLIEIIVVIVVMSIISIGIVQYIIDSASGYSRTAIRSELSASGRVVIDRIAMDLHNALPNSVRVTSAYTSGSGEVTGGDAYAGDQCIEFVPILSATTYIDPRFRPQTHTTTFTVVDFVPPVTNTISAYISIFPRSTGQIYNADFSDPTTAAIAGASVADSNTGDGVNEVTTITNHRFRRSSPTMRAFMVDEPISYCVKGEQLFRYTNYGFNSTQLRPVDIDGSCSGTCLPDATPDRVLMTSYVDNAGLTDAGSQAFDFLNANRRRNAVVQLELNFEKGNSGDEVLLNHEVLLHSSP